MSDRVVVMNHGRIEQVGTPRTVFERPATAFVADFMGHRTILYGTVGSADADRVVLDVAGRRFPARWSGAEAPLPGASAFLALHPRLVRVHAVDTPGALPGRVTAAVYKGTDVEVTVETDLGPVVAAEHAMPAEGPAFVTYDADAAVAGPIAGRD